MSWKIVLKTRKDFMKIPCVCFGCRANLGQGARSKQPASHPYIGASANCWEVYSEILAKEYNDPEFMRIHRLTVDAYMAQHGGDQSDRRARQSMNLHVIALYLYFEKKESFTEILRFLRTATEYKRDWPPLEAPTDSDWQTVFDVVGADNANDHACRVTSWAQSVWKVFAPLKDEIQARFEQI